MIMEKKFMENHVLHVTLTIDKMEFDAARREAYVRNTDRYPVMGIAPGMAALPDLEKIYGPAVLYDEALAVVVPDTFSRFVRESQIRVFGKPEVENVQYNPDGGVSFQVKAPVFPEVELGQYKNLAVPYVRKEQQREFEQAVIQKACENLKGEIPPNMIDQKIQAIMAQEKLSIHNDAVYHLLADMLVILDQAYVAAGVSRPKVQVRREAMDLMLQTASAEHEMDWKPFLKEQVTLMAERYHSLSDDFEQELDRIIQKRAEAKAKKKPDELLEELFQAYLGSLELTEEQWKNQRSTQAAREVCMDLLLDAVSEKENITIHPDEAHQFIEELADQYGIAPEEAEANIDPDALIWKLKRDKALRLILDSAVTDEEGKKKLDRKRENLKKNMEKDVEIRNETESSGDGKN